MAEKNCESCEYANRINSAPSGWSFIGCSHKPYHGKMCSEIEKCPKEQEEKVMLNELAKEVHQNAIEHGWWKEERSFGEIIALCHSELSEALEEYRNARPSIYVDDFENCKRITDVSEFAGRKPEGVATELADCIIRILDYCGRTGIDIDEAIRIKHEYNKTRPYRHGGKVI